MFKNYVNTIYDQAVSQVTLMTKMATSGEEIAMSKWIDERIVFNTLVISAIFGAEITPNKAGKMKIKFNHAMPTQEQILKIAKLVKAVTVLEEDMGSFKANVEDTVRFALYAEVPQYEKIKIKTVKNDILGTGADTFPMIQMLINEHDVLELAALAENVRKIVTRNTILIIGGITLAVAAAAGVGVYVYNKKKGEDDQAEEDEGMDMDSDDLPEIDMDSDDIPVVDLDAE